MSPYRETERPTEIEDPENQMVLHGVRIRAWRSFYQHALDALTKTLSTWTAEDIAKRAEEIADAAYGRWLPRHAASIIVEIEIGEAQLVAFRKKL